MNRLDLHEIGFGGGRRNPPPSMERAHHHHEVELNFLFAGEVLYLHRGVPRKLESNRIAVFWGAVPHTLIQASPDADLAWITVPLADLRRSNLESRFLTRLLEGEWCVSPQSEATRFPFGDWVSELLQPSSPRARAGLRFEILGCLWWLAERVTTGPTSALNDRSGLRSVEAMARFMARNYLDPLDVATIARAAGLHPNYAMTLFRQRCGVTLRDYLVQLRLTHAQRLLLEEDAKVTEAALASGFGTLSAFYAAFTQRVGLTPRAYRARFRPPAP